MCTCVHVYMFMYACTYTCMYMCICTCTCICMCAFVYTIHCYREAFYNGDPSLPVYEWTKPKQHYSIEELARIVAANSVSPTQICSKLPYHVQKNAAFVIDLHKLDNPLDVRADENGSWIRKGSPTAYVSVHENHGSVTINRRSKMGDFSHHFKISRTYYRHSASPDFYRTITMA